MAKKKFPAREKGNKSIQGLFCKDCEIATDYHEKDVKGEYFMCKCKYFPYSRFLRHDYCENLVPKKRK